MHSQKVEKRALTLMPIKSVVSVREREGGERFSLKLRAKR